MHLHLTFKLCHLKCSFNFFQFKNKIKEFHHWCCLHTHFRVLLVVIFIIEVPTVTMRCITAIKMLFLYFNFTQSIKLDSLSCSFTLISFLTFWTILIFSSSDFHSPWNENLNLLLQIKFLNLLVYVYKNVVLNKNWKKILVQTKFYWYILGRRNGVHSEDCLQNPCYFVMGKIIET